MSKNAFYEQVGVAMTCRSYEEYEKMFDLNLEQFKGEKVLDVAAGASSFTTSAYHKGYDAYAVDPLYNLSVEEMRKHGEEEIQEASRKLKKGARTLLWDSYNTLEEHDKIRRDSFSLFMEQYTQNEKEQRFFHGALPHLPFSDHTFALLLCNHFLFLYEKQFNFEFHVKALKEMIRITKKGGEIRIYPLVGFNHEIYPYLNNLIETLENDHVKIKLLPTTFRFMPKATEMLVIYKK